MEWLEPVLALEEWLQLMARWTESKGMRKWTAELGRQIKVRAGRRLKGV